MLSEGQFLGGFFWSRKEAFLFISVFTCFRRSFRVFMRKQKTLFSVFVTKKPRFREQLVLIPSQPRDSGAWAGPVPNPTTHCRHSMRLSEKPAGAVHRNWSSGRGSLSERPSTRCSNSRAVPAPGSAGPEGCPAHHASPSHGHEEKSLSTFFQSCGQMLSRCPCSWTLMGML